MPRYGNGPTYGAQANVQAADIAFSIHTQVDSAFYDIEYPEHDWYKILTRDQVMRDINAGATSYAYITRDKQGAAAFVGNGPNNDIPMVAQSAGAVTVPVAYAAVGAIITNEDARQYQFGFNGNLAQDLGEGMRKAVDNLTEATVIFGNEDLGLLPWINYPDIAITQIAAPWSGKDGAAMVQDVNTVLETMWMNSRTLFLPQTVFLPMAQFVRLNATPMVINGTGLAQTALEYLKLNNITTQQTGQELLIYPSRYLAGAGDAGADRMVVMDRDRRNQCLPFPMEYLLSQPVPVPLAAELYAEMKIGSFHVRQQGSMMYADGI